VECLKLLVELAKVEQAQTPWYERSLSAVGVVAFFSMIIATGWQTVQTSLGEAKLQAMQKEQTQLINEEKAMDTHLSQISRAISTQARQAGKVDEEYQPTLRFRLEYLRSQEKLDDSQIVEMCDLALLMEDSTTLIDAIQRDSGLVRRLKPVDIITIAEYFYTVNSPGKAEELVELVEPQSINLSKASRIRLLALEASIRGLARIEVHQLTDLLQLPPDAAME